MTAKQLIFSLLALGSLLATCKKDNTDPAVKTCLITRIEDKYGKTQMFEYDNQNRVIKINSNTTTYSTVAYTGSQIVFKTFYSDPQNNSIDTYTLVNGVIVSKTGSGYITNFEYDNSGNLIKMSKNRTDGSPSSGSETATYTYENGNLKSVSRKLGDGYSYLYTYEHYTTILNTSKPFLHDAVAGKPDKNALKRITIDVTTPTDTTHWNIDITHLLNSDNLITQSSFDVLIGDHRHEEVEKFEYACK